MRIVSGDVETWYARACEAIPWDAIISYDPLGPGNSSDVTMKRRMEFRKGIRATLLELGECKDKRTKPMKAAIVLCLLHASEPIGPKDYYRSVLGWTGPRMHLRTHLVDDMATPAEIDAFLESTAFNTERMGFCMRSWEEPDPSHPNEVDTIHRNAETFLSHVRIMLGGQQKKEPDCEEDSYLPPPWADAGVRKWARRMQQEHVPRNYTRL